jgi:aerobic-type carbon monoxide dehydrogenase small subunit (CoxS/CutS family)
MPQSLKVNGQRRDVDASPDTPLLWVLRDHLNLTGTKYGCGLGICGACTIEIDGHPARACQVSLGDARGAAITTIEGLSANGDHPVQAAWLAEDVAQCGFCQPGMIMEAACLLAARPGASDRDIDETLRDHVCRCGTYPRIRRAIHRAGGAK